MAVGGLVLALLDDLDGLYESVVLDAKSWDETAFADWMESAMVDGEGLDRQALNILRRGLRRARRLQGYWAGRSDGPSDWRMRVDETLGSAAWRPGLELAEWGMAIDPTPELFAALQERFRAVTFQPFVMSYDEWIEAHSPTD